MEKGPRVMVCYICGREYGLASLKIHQKTCKRLFLQREARKPKHLRKKLPKESEISKTVDVRFATPEQRRAMRLQANKTFNNDVLEACPNCGRTFLPDSLKVHLRSCTKVSPAKRVGGERGGSLKPRPSSSSSTSNSRRRPLREKIRTRRRSSAARAAGSSAMRDSFVHARGGRAMELEKEDLTADQRMSSPRENRFFPTPGRADADADADAAAKSEAKGEWQRAVTKEGNAYYYHTGSGRVQWTPPGERRSNFMIRDGKAQGGMDREKVMGLVSSLEERVNGLETKVGVLNAEISDMKGIISALRDVL